MDPQWVSPSRNLGRRSAGAGVVGDGKSMGLELVYTSARKGLKPGSVGFCTVAMSRRMSPTLAATLESLSGYRHLCTAENTSYTDNPVNFCHYLIPDRGRVARVIARIGAAPADYTGRTNKLAHFVVLDAAELPLAGPAWLLERPGLMLEAWGGEPRWIEKATAIPAGDSVSAPCAAWQRVTGDAGWAGDLLGRFCDRPESPVHVLCKPGTPVLALFAEAMALLPPEMRWRIAFSTYFAGLPAAGIKCHWRGLIAGSAVLDNKIDPQSVIDLTRPLCRAPDGPCQQAARDGTPIDPEKLRAPVVTSETPITLAAPLESPGRKATRSQAAAFGTFGLEPFAPGPPATRFLHPHYLDDTGGERHARRNRRWVLPVVWGVVASIILVAIGAFFLIRHYFPRQRPRAMAAVNSFGAAKRVRGAAPAKGGSSAAAATATDTGRAAKPTGAAPPGAAGAAAAKAPAAEEGAAKASRAQAAKLAGANASGIKKPASGTAPGKGVGSAVAHSEKNAQAGAKPIPSQRKKAPSVAKEAPAKAYRLTVLNKRIFAPPKAGGFSVSGNSDDGKRTVVVRGVTSFRIALPAKTRGGTLSLAGNAKSAAAWKIGKWYPIGAAGKRINGNELYIQWASQPRAGLSSVQMRKVAQLRVDPVKSSLVVRPTKWAEDKIRSGKNTGERIARVMARTAVDVRLSGSRCRRIQFRDKFAKPVTRKLSQAFPVTGNHARTLALVVESFSPPPGLVYHPPARDSGLVWIGLMPAPETRPNHRLESITFSISKGRVESNYHNILEDVNRAVGKLHGEVKKWTVPAGKNSRISISRVRAQLTRDKKRVAGIGEKKPGEGETNRLTMKIKRLRGEVRKYKALEEKMVRMQKRQRHLERFPPIRLGVELYPGGPVLETVTYRRPGLVARPAPAAAARPAGK